MLSRTSPRLFCPMNSDAMSPRIPINEFIGELNGHSDFTLGTICVTPGVRESIAGQDVSSALHFHGRKIWPRVSEDGWVENEYVMAENFSFHSAYYSEEGIEFWIITAGDRDNTTVLLRSEY
jgi:hypothetical protein